MREIIGIVGDVKQEDLRRGTAPQVYESFLQQPRAAFNVVVRGVSDPSDTTNIPWHKSSAEASGHPDLRR
jgi:hypothetical protein